MDWVGAQLDVYWIVPRTFHGVISSKIKTAKSVQSNLIKYYIGVVTNGMAFCFVILGEERKQSMANFSAIYLLLSIIECV